MPKAKYTAVIEKTGRPTDYTPELGQRICRLIATHSIGLRKLIEQYDLPERQTIFNWLNVYPDFFDQYMTARQQQAHVLADEVIQLHNDIPIYLDKEGNERIDSGMLGRAKLQMEGYRWTTARLAPKYYGDNKNTESNNKDLDEDIKKRYQEMDEKNKKEC